MENWPGQHMPPVHARFRASDADRERLVETLKAAFAQGSLSREEFGAATARALRARTYGELGAIVAAIPAPAARPTPQVMPRRTVDRKVIALIVVLAVVPVALWATLTTYYGGFIVMFAVAFLSSAVVAVPPTSDTDYPGARRFW